MDYNVILQRCRQLFERMLGGNLVGIYVHGSIAFGCFTWEKSDIDFLVVTRTAMTYGEKLSILKGLLEINEEAPDKGIEMSVMQLKDTLDFKHPAHFDLHYSNGHYDWAHRDPEDYCRKMNGEDPDLAAHCTVINHVGQVLCGLPIDMVFGPVAKEDYLDSICGDVENAIEDVKENPVYIILNLCRVLAYVRENLVLSKKQGGEWGIRNLPEEYRMLIAQALLCYQSTEEMILEEDGFVLFERLWEVYHEYGTCTHKD